MTDHVLSSFDTQTKEFVLSELEDMGTIAVSAGLEAELLVKAGEIETFGVTQDAIDGSAAASVANADLAAIALGHPRVDEDPDIVDAIAPYMEELRATPGLADLARRVLDLVSDPDYVRFAKTKGTQADAETFQSVVSAVKARIEAAKADFPGTWDLGLTGASITLTMHETVGETATND